MTVSSDLESLEAFAVELARAAAAVIRPFFRTDADEVNKAASGRFDPVTAADKGAEAEIRRLIALHRPDDGVIGEEYGEDRPDAEQVWVLDPVDGTRAFICGIPLFTTLIAVRQFGKPAVGVISQPILDEIYVGSARGARLLSGGEETVLKTRACAGLASAALATTDAELFSAAERPAWDSLRDRGRVTRYGADAYAFAQVAAGRIDLGVESGLKCWDIDAAIPVLAGAGGGVCNWRGEPVGAKGGQVVVWGDARARDEALELLAGAAA